MLYADESDGKCASIGH